MSDKNAHNDVFRQFAWTLAETLAGTLAGRLAADRGQLPRPPKPDERR